MLSLTDISINNLIYETRTEELTNSHPNTWVFFSYLNLTIVKVDLVNYEGKLIITDLLEVQCVMSW